MLRIGHLTPTFFSDSSVIGGGERYVDNIVRALATTGGFAQTIVSLGPEDAHRAAGHAELRILRNESAQPDAMDGVSPRLAEAVRHFDLVHVHQCLTGFGAYAIAAARSAAVPVIGTDLGGGSDPLLLGTGGIELLDGIVSISAFAQRLVAGAYSGPAEVLVGPVDTDAFSPDAAVARDPRVVLCVGRLLPHKGVDRVIAALPEGLRLVVVGRPYDARYDRLLRRMARGKAVRFVADADDAALLGLYRRAAVLVQASTARDVFGNATQKPELMGLTTLEAMACGLPTIVSDAGSLPELVPDPRFGRVFASDAALAALLAEVAHGSWPGPGAAALARDHVIAAHGMAATGVRLAAFYRAVQAAPRWGGPCAS